jgi:hypothetical protein
MKITLRVLFIFAVIAGLSLSVYLLASIHTYRLGFPLDDAWIHQTYARNLALWSEWAFIRGQPSAGSTAPLWSAILAMGYLLKVNLYLWTFSVGWVFLIILAMVGLQGFREFGIILFSPNNKIAWSIGAGILLLMEWHIVWASASGMETMLFALMVTLILVWLAAGWKRWFLLGVFIAMSVWIRPDGVTLLVLAVLVLAITNTNWPDRLKAGVFLSLGFCLLFLPYLLFNHLLAGNWWPNTFYAKQAEYAVLQTIPLWKRWLQQFCVMLVGVGILLLPGFVYYTWRAYRHRAWSVLFGIGWILAYVGLYAWRLPLVYQHGRYVMPVMPVFFLLGYCGLEKWFYTNTDNRWHNLISRAWLFSTVLILLSFWILGASSYGRDVAVIESEMVDTANWVAENTAPNELVAAHDIGALGYWSKRRLLDLAGLISPEVIPFIRNEKLLAFYLDEQKAEYLVAFPGWYPELTHCARLLYRGSRDFSLRQGGESMAVYRWIPDCFKIR